MAPSLATRRSGVAFLIVGLLGGIYFWLTDPRLGPKLNHTPTRHLDWHYWLFVLRGSADNVMDAANQAWLGTAVGIAGCVALIVVGLWLLTRRPV